MNDERIKRGGIAVRYTPTGEVFRSIREAARVLLIDPATIKKRARDQGRADWEIVITEKLAKKGRGKLWTPEELALLREHINDPIGELLPLFPDRTRPSLITQRSLEKHGGRKRNTGTSTMGPPTDEEREANRRRPPTHETAYLCRIDYRDKRRLGYSRERAIKWVAEADGRAVDIVEDLLFNPAYDADVARLARANSANLHQGRGHGVKFWEEMMGCSRETD